MEASHQCNACQAPAQKLCTQCRQVYYCSVECQRKDWKEHKTVCKAAVNVDEELRKMQRDLKIEDFEVIKQIGEGNFTRILQVYHQKFPDKYYALKTCSIQKVTSLRKETDILMEKHVLNKVLQDHISKGLPESELPCLKIIATFKDQMNLYFLTELLQEKKEVWEHLRTFGFLNNEFSRYTFYQICKGVKRLHDLEIIHRDLKPENMFFTQDFRSVKLIDFGSAEDFQNLHLRAQKIDNNPKRTQHVNFVGTAQYMAPECVKNQGTLKSSDIWSLGCILYQFYLGVTPFRGASDYLIFVRSTEANFALQEISEFLIPAKIKVLIQKMLQVNHEARPTIDEILNDEAFDSVRNLEQAPQLNAFQSMLKEHCQDFIKRGNVYKLEGQQKFVAYFDNELKPKLIQQASNLNQEEVEIILSNVKQLALWYIFDVEFDERVIQAKEAANTCYQKSIEEQRLKREEEEKEGEVKEHLQEKDEEKNVPVEIKENEVKEVHEDNQVAKEEEEQDEQKENE